MSEIFLWKTAASNGLIVRMWHKILTAITSRNSLLVLTGLSWIITVLFGTGIIPQNKTHELDLAVKTTELRRQEIEQYDKLMVMVAGYLKIPIENESVEKLRQLENQMTLAKDDLYALETKLARLENRQPRTYLLRFPAYKALTITILPAKEPAAKPESKSPAPSN